MTKRATEPVNAVNRDALINAAIMAEKMALYGQGKKMFTQIETEQQVWKPTMKIFPNRDCYELPTYPRKPRSQRDQE
ncbi:Conserved_hypothetical protein [Hexamita inflata]|uniref:Uncharacterized protein n=1 Tax=Hexamita inflata TaxID=28002 RepID=A0AA86RVK2_9EUKA|nr:Conserved hypothetical protein [Hexamita inflata]